MTTTMPKATINANIYGEDAENEEELYYCPQCDGELELIGVKLVCPDCGWSE